MRFMSREYQLLLLNLAETPNRGIEVMAKDPAGAYTHTEYALTSSVYFQFQTKLDHSFNTARCRICQDLSPRAPLDRTTL